MALKGVSHTSIFRYWKQMVLLPSVLTSIIVCAVAILSLQFINHQLDELQKIADIVSESVYDKIDSTTPEELSDIVFDIGKLYNVVIIVSTPDDEPVVSYPAVTELISKSLSFNLVYKHPIELRDGTLLGNVVIKRAEQLIMGLSDITLFVGAIVMIFLASWLWHLKFSKPMVTDVLNLSLNGGTEKRIRFKEIRDVSNLLKKQSQELKDMAVNKAIARMTKMLAHDTRQPFAAVYGVLTLLESCDDPAESKKIARRYTQDIRKSLQAVDDMLSDIMEVGSNKQPKKEPTDVQTIIETTLNDCFRFNASADISFDYRFNHLHLLNVDRLKITRALSNIVTNAAEAMHFKGAICFRTHEVDKKMIMTVGNTNSYIPPDERDQVFEAFYTKNKKAGTGLGLAITRQIVSAHGGQITCKSDIDRGTQFEFSLPIAEIPSATPRVSLPISTTGIRNTQISAEVREYDVGGINDKELESKILATGKTVHMLIADDEPIYRDALRKQIQQSSVGGLVRMIYADSGEEAVKAVKQSDPHIIVIDINFGDRGKIDGFEAVRKIRALGSTSKICIHSNQGVLGFQANAVKAGCDLFLPKPMTRSHILTIMAASIDTTG